MRPTGITSRRTRGASAALLAALALATGAAGAQTRRDTAQTRRDTVGFDPRQIALLIDAEFARSLAATLAHRDVAGTVTSATGPARQTESLRLRLRGQWGSAAEIRVPVGASRRWGVELYGSRFRGRADGSFVTSDSAVAPGGGSRSDVRNYDLRGVRTWRATLGVARAVPVGRLPGVAFLGATYGRVHSNSASCPSGSGSGSVVCVPVAALDLDTPGVTAGFDVMSLAWHRFRLRVGAKADVLSVDEADVRNTFKPATLTTAVGGEGGRVWRVLPSLTFGLVYQLRLWRHTEPDHS